MKFSKVLHLVVLFVSLACWGCSQTEGTKPTAERSTMARLCDEQAPDDIFDLLADYPALESFFTDSGLDRATFEDKMYKRILGNDTYADTVVAMLAGLPPLFDQRQVPGDDIFAEEIMAEMNNKGPVPDLLSALAGLVGHVVDLPEANKQPLYDYLDRLDQKESSSAEALETMNYIREILYRAISYQTTLDDSKVNDSMDILATDLAEMQVSTDGELDFADIDHKFAEWAHEAPEGIASLLRGSKKLCYDDAVKDSLADLLYSLGTTLGDDNLYPVMRDTLSAIHASHDRDSLGRVLDGMWTRGPIIGERLARVGIPGYGKDGLQDHGLRQLMLHPQVVDRIVEYIARFEQNGLHTDGQAVATRLREMIECDPHLQDRAGEGVFAGVTGTDFYQPTDDIDFKDYSYLRGLIKFGARFHTGLTLTSPLLWEHNDTEETLGLLRSLIPTVDRIAISNLLWSPMFIKDENKFLGGGHPITTKDGYGVMMDYDESYGGFAYSGLDPDDKVWVTPGCAGVATGAESAFLSIVDTIENGPFDNIWDNANYMLYERDIYLVLDLVQVSKRLGLIGDILSSPLGPAIGLLLEILSGSSVECIPLVLLKVDGINGLIHTELTDVIDELEVNLERGLRHSVPAWVKNAVMGLFSQPAVKKLVGDLLISGMGKPETDTNGNTRYYMYPQDLRDTWPIILSAVGYFDPQRFYPEKFVDRQVPENYRWNYDTWHENPDDDHAGIYRYENHADKASPLLPLLAAVSLASKDLYHEAAGHIPTSLDYLEARQAAGREAFGVIVPLSYIVNLMTNLAEMPIDTHSYIAGGAGVHMPLAETIEPLMYELELAETLAAVVDLSTILGSEDMRDARREILEGIAPLIATTSPTSSAPYTLAGEILSGPAKALEDPRRWEALETNLAMGAALLGTDSPYQVTETIVSLVDHLTDIDIADDEWALVADGIAQVMDGCGRDRFLARVLIDTADIIGHLNTTHCWGDSLDLFQATLDPGGAISYVLLGMERNPAWSWDAILTDTHRFLLSDTMQLYGEGSFWKDIYYLIAFMNDAIE